MAKIQRLSVGLSAGRGGRASRYYPSDPEFLADVREQTKAMTDKLLSVINQFEDVTPDIMLQALEPTKALADYYCPVDTGDLKESGYLEVTSVGKSKTPRVELGYGRNKSPFYTLYVHEIPMNHAAPTRWKWLEAAIMEDAGNLLSRLATHYKTFMGPGAKT